jgi:hypothetical protein
MNKSDSPKDNLEQILASAKRLGVELDEEEALQWLAAISAAKSGGDVEIDTRTGVFGHKVSMLDFSTDQLEYFRKLGKLVEFDDLPDHVETALALSGSAAQSKIQSYPGDADFFERVNIITDTREQACRVLGKLVRQKALETAQGPTYRLIEVKFGSHPMDIKLEDKHIPAGSPISWTVPDIQKGSMDGTSLEGKEVSIKWEDAAQDPGWVKLDWVVADPINGQLANASNMLDVTWEATDGTIIPLDGYLDPYFQEVYLEAESIPIFSKLAKHVSADALDEYVRQLEGEVNKYLTKDVNYGKAAKRMYNIFRLTGRYEEAAFIRELFDEPATLLYQVWSLIRTIDDVMQEEVEFSPETLKAQADNLIISVVDVLEGEQESEVVRYLLRLKDALGRDDDGQAWHNQVQTARAEVINIVNNFFFDRLTAVPEIQAYIDTIKEGKG